MHYHIDIDPIIGHHLFSRYDSQLLNTAVLDVGGHVDLTGCPSLSEAGILVDLTEPALLAVLSKTVVCLMETLRARPDARHLSGNNLLAKYLTQRRAEGVQTESCPGLPN